MPKIDYSMEAVPTFYNGITYRSRLEARWAAFFDLCKWRHEYEPMDFNGWFPDFVLFGEKGNLVMVEVKPIAELNDELTARIDRSGCPHEVLILGLCPTLQSQQFSGSCRLGWLRENGEWWEEAVLFQPCVKYRLDDEDKYVDVGKIAAKYPVDFCHAMGSYSLRISGLYDGDHFLGSLDRIRVAELWGLAHDMTRYDPF